MNFANRNVLVTGGSRGIGKAVSLAFARAGAAVAVLYRENRGVAEATLAQLPGDGHFALRADVADPAAVASAVDEAMARWGRIDVLVNNAGIGVYHRLAEVSYEEWREAWRRTLTVNLEGPANLSYCVARRMMASGGGRIVNITSRGAFRGEPLKPAYGAAKAALNSLSQSLAVALAPWNIFVGAVAPGFVNTELTADRLAGPEGIEIRGQSPFNRVAEPEEVAHAVLFLASDGAEFATGAIIDVNGASYLRT